MYPRYDLFLSAPAQSAGGRASGRCADRSSSMCEIFCSKRMRKNDISLYANCRERGQIDQNGYILCAYLLFEHIRGPALNGRKAMRSSSSCSRTLRLGEHMSSAHTHLLQLCGTRYAPRYPRRNISKLYFRMSTFPNDLSSHLGSSTAPTRATGCSTLQSR